MPTVKSLIFLAYITAIFFLPNNWWVAVGVIIDLTALSYQLWRSGSDVLGVILRKTFAIIPFIIFAMVFNWWLDSLWAAVWIGLKLVIVCNATLIYAASMTVTEVARIIANLLSPLKFLGVKPDETRILVAIALMMIPVLRKNLREMQQACRAKGLKWNIDTFKIVLQKLGYTSLAQVNQLEEGLLAKGYEIDD